MSEKISLDSSGHITLKYKRYAREYNENVMG